MTSFNRIEGNLDILGEIPIWMTMLYFVIVGGIYTASIAMKGVKFNTLDLVYVGIGGALSVVLEFYIGPWFSKLVPKVPGLGLSFDLRLFMVTIFTAIIRKLGSLAALLAIFDLSEDQFHYSSSGKPVYLIYEASTSGSLYIS